jgi:hypothetical protein
MTEKPTTLEPFNVRDAHTLLAMAGKWLDYISVMDPKPPLTFENLKLCLGPDNYSLGIYIAVAMLVNQAVDWEARLRRKSIAKEKS